MLSARGIEANPDKCMAVINMASPQNLKGVQKLVGRLTTLSRFLPCLAEIAKPIVEKVALGLDHTARHLRQYFQSHRVIVKTDCLVAKVLRKPELAGRMMAWSIELSKFDIVFESRSPIKSQCLVDFVNELQPKGHFISDLWTMHVDGSSNNQGSGVGVILEAPTGLILEQSLRFAFKASNNQAEYEALLAGLRLAQEIRARRLMCWTDSKVVSEQVNDNFQVKEPNLSKYYHLFQRIRDTFDEVQVKHTPRKHNERADQLARLASKPTECMTVEEPTQTWITEIMDYLELGKESSDPSAAKRLRTKAAREIHEGICGFHLGGRTLAIKVLRAGYYWPTLKSDCIQLFKRCLSCQRHGNLIHASAEDLGIKHRFTPFEHPQSNGQAEAANKVILTELKKRLGDAKGAWAKELLEVLWAYRCNPQSTIKETPFRLTYGTDGMIPVEVGEPSFWRQHFYENDNEASLRAEVDMIDEVRTKAQIMAEACKQRIARRFNSTLSKREFHEGDLFWRVQGSARCNPREGKLAANWDGPFRIRHNL
uniref:Uncharacterized protein Mb2253c family n=1 Tax=Cajanus cajan TaxID=3821 RepID=A0A151TL41_CAJCA|nr:Uncharacterized protein Mb2253c family [Cajanus cajan]